MACHALLRAIRPAFLPINLAIPYSGIHNKVPTVLSTGHRRTGTYRFGKPWGRFGSRFRSCWSLGVPKIEHVPPAGERLPTSSLKRVAAATVLAAATEQ